jgi:hypothetical protein
MILALYLNPDNRLPCAFKVCNAYMINLMSDTPMLQAVNDEGDVNGRLAVYIVSYVIMSNWIVLQVDWIM